jgi:hypothetical protein
LLVNKNFLDAAIVRGDPIVLSSNAFEATGSFKWEVDYLIQQGYKVSWDGWKIYKP